MPAASLSLLLVIAFALAANLDSWFQGWPGNRRQTSDAITIALGDARHLFANHFLAKADAYFHRGNYPSIFDRREDSPPAHSESGERAHSARPHEEREGEGAALHAPLDWIERFGREFYPSKHSHLDEESGGSAQGVEREILPWLYVSANLDPERAETFSTAAFWLRTRLNRPDEAERMLRTGLRANPRNPLLLFDLGLVYFENRHDPVRAQNLWELASLRWRQVEAPKPEPDILLFAQITGNLAGLAEKQTNYLQAVALWESLRAVSPHKAIIDQTIAELRRKLSAPTPVR